MSMGSSLIPSSWGTVAHHVTGTRSRGAFGCGSRRLPPIGGIRVPTGGSGPDARGVGRAELRRPAARRPTAPPGPPRRPPCAWSSPASGSRRRVIAGPTAEPATPSTASAAPVTAIVPAAAVGHSSTRKNASGGHHSSARSGAGRPSRVAPRPCLIVTRPERPSLGSGRPIDDGWVTSVRAGRRARWSSRRAGRRPAPVSPPPSSTRRPGLQEGHLRVLPVHVERGDRVAEQRTGFASSPRAAAPRPGRPPPRRPRDPARPAEPEPRLDEPVDDVVHGGAGELVDGGSTPTRRRRAPAGPPAPRSCGGRRRRAR